MIGCCCAAVFAVLGLGLDGFPCCLGFTHVVISVLLKWLEIHSTNSTLIALVHSLSSLEAIRVFLSHIHLVSEIVVVLDLVFVRLSC